MYTEIILDGMHYFIATQNLQERAFDLNTPIGKRSLLLMSDFVVNAKSNELVKCRQTMTDIVRTYCRQCV